MHLLTVRLRTLMIAVAIVAVGIAAYTQWRVLAWMSLRIVATAALPSGLIFGALAILMVGVSAIPKR